uniref:Uncharacterized protein n=1 Tax=Picea glauca TaxID=3330 RepID=A0A101LXD5_PICGL|nr:hypothetical protein ABT39_MTgene6070 [Picea glauca]
MSEHKTGHSMSKGKRRNSMNRGIFLSLLSGPDIESSVEIEGGTSAGSTNRDVGHSTQG